MSGPSKGLSSILFVVLLSASIAAIGQTASTQDEKKDTPRRVVPPDKRGTKAQPLVIEGIPAQQDERAAREQREHRASQNEIGTSVSKALHGLEEESSKATLLTFAVALIAVIQAGLFVWQLYEMRVASRIARSSANAARRAVLMARDNSRRETRAYLGVGGGEVFPLPSLKHTVIRGTVEIRNFGNTPARNVRVAIAGELREPGEKKPFPEPEFLEHTQPIAPTMGWIIGREFHEMSEEDMKDVLADKKLVYIWGRASYDDIYGRPHTLSFRLRNVVKVFGKNEEGVLVMHHWKYYPEPEGNDAN